MPSRLGSHLTLVIVLPVIFIATVSLLIFAFTQDCQRTTILIRHSNVVLDKAQRINAALSDAELNIRAYLFLHQPRLIERYRRIRSDIMIQTTSLKALVAQNSTQERNAAFIEDDTSTWFSHLDKIGDLAVRGQYTSRDFQKSLPNIVTIKLSASASLAEFISTEQTNEEQLVVLLTSQSRNIQIVSAAALWIGISLTVFLKLGIRREFQNRLQTLLIAGSSLARGGDLLANGLNGNDDISKLHRYFHVISERLTEREERLNRYRILADETNDIVLFLEGEVVVEANVAAAQAYGYAREEMRGMSIFQIRAPDLHDNLRQWLKQRQLGDERFETIHRRADGSRFPVEVTMRTTERYGKRLWAAVMRDISGRKYAENTMQTALEAANRASHLKSLFVASMSHEIRTPLNAILGMSELLLRTDLNLEQAEYVRSVHLCGNDLLRTINNVLDFSMIETGRLTIGSAEFELANCIDLATKECLNDAQRKGLVLTSFVDPNLPHIVQGDGDQIRRILVSVLDNAVKFTESGQISLSATLEHRARQIVGVHVTIKDTGIGISPNLGERIFRPFLQGDGSITRRFGGSGLGLAITRRLVELMTGTIDVESIEGVGTTVSLHFQFNVVEKHAMVADSFTEADALKMGNQSRILVVEDNEVNKRLAARQLEKLGYSVTLAGNGHEAVQAFDQMNLDLILMDCHLPEMDGFAATIEIRKRELRTGKRTPIIALTANARHEDRIACLAADMDDYLAKPVSLDSLSETLKRWL
jgi:PAS domain S-box-containing protein